MKVNSKSFYNFGDISIKRKSGIINPVTKIKNKSSVYDYNQNVLRNIKLGLKKSIRNGKRGEK